MIRAGSTITKAVPGTGIPGAKGRHLFNIDRKPPWAARYGHETIRIPPVATVTVLSSAAPPSSGPMRPTISFIASLLAPAPQRR
jgi:hypothetical protein